MQGLEKPSSNIQKPNKHRKRQSENPKTDYTTRGRKSDRLGSNGLCTLLFSLFCIFPFYSCLAIGFSLLNFRRQQRNIAHGMTGVHRLSPLANHYLLLLLLSCQIVIFSFFEDILQGYMCIIKKRSIFEVLLLVWGVFLV